MLVANVLLCVFARSEQFAAQAPSSTDAAAELGRLQLFDKVLGRQMLFSGVRIRNA